VHIHTTTAIVAQPALRILSLLQRWQIELPRLHRQAPAATQFPRLDSGRPPCQSFQGAQGPFSRRSTGPNIAWHSGRVPVRTGTGHHGTAFWLGGLTQLRGVAHRPPDGPHRSPAPAQLLAGWCRGCITASLAQDLAAGPKPAFQISVLGLASRDC